MATFSEKTKTPVPEHTKLPLWIRFKRTLSRSSSRASLADNASTTSISPLLLSEKMHDTTPASSPAQSPTTEQDRPDSPVPRRVQHTSWGTLITVSEADIQARPRPLPGVSYTWNEDGTYDTSIAGVWVYAAIGAI